MNAERQTPNIKFSPPADLSVMESLRRRTVAQRFELHDRALTTAMSLRRALEKQHAGVHGTGQQAH
jgi:hypothetical protein